MQPITAPIRPDERSSNVVNLQTALRMLGFPVDDVTELQEQRAGNLTRRAILGFMGQNGLRPTDRSVLDQPTADLINKLLDERGLLDKPDSTQTFVVHGTVRDNLGLPQPGLTVVAFDVDLRNREELGNAQTNADGQYEIGYSPAQFRRAKKANADLLLRVMAATGAVQYESPTILFNAPATATIDIALDGGIYRGASEYELLLRAIASTLGTIPLSDLQENDQQAELTFVANDAQQPYEQVVLAAKASRLGIQTGINPVFFYGIGRQQTLNPLQLLDLNFIRQPTIEADATTDLDQLSHHSPDFLIGQFRSAVAQNTVPALTDEELNQIQTVLTRVTTQPDPDESDQVLGSIRFAGRHQALQTVLEEEFGPITAKTAPRLAALTTTDWAQRISQDPDWVTTISIDSQQMDRRAALTAYAQQLERRTERLFPTATVATRVLTDKALTQGPAIAKLLTDNPDFDIRTTPVDTLLRNVSLTPEAAQELKSVQRVYRLSDSYGAASVLLSDRLNSAQAVYFAGREAFLAKYGSHPDIGPRQASRIYNRAQQVYATGLKLFTDAQTALHAGGILAVGKTVPALTPALAEQFPNLATLFATTDQCACEHCRSVYSPAAYLVDLLHFLSERNSTNSTNSVKDVLFGRRPDIGLLDLNCANTNTALPYIDLVCELLEDAVAPPTAGSPTHQTHLTTPELNANPEYVRLDAYSILKKARFPIQMPFDLYTSEVDAYLPQLGMNRCEVMLTFQPMTPDGAAPTPITIAAAYFSINATELDIIVNPPSLADLAMFWTGNPAMSSAALLPTVGPLPAFMNFTGLIFDEIQQLLALPLLNTDGTLRIDASKAPCDTSQMSVAGLSVERLGLIYRLIRLWRRVGWTMGELDRSIRTPAIGGSNFNANLLPRLQAMDELRTAYGLSIDQLISFYGDLPTTSDNAGTYSLYDQLFQNRSITNPVDAGLAVGALSAGSPVSDHKGALLAGLGVTMTDLPLLGLVETTSVSLDRLSDAYRQIRLARLLNQPLAGLMLLRKLIPDNPFSMLPGKADATARFIDLTRRLLDSGFSLPVLNYLLRNEDDPSAPLAPGDTRIGNFLTNLRSTLKATKTAQVIDTSVNDSTGDLTRPYLSKLGFDEMTLDQLMEAIVGGRTPAERTVLFDRLSKSVDAPLKPDNFGSIPAETSDADVADIKATRFRTILEAVSDFQVRLATEQALIDAFTELLTLDEPTTRSLLTTLQLAGGPLLQHPEFVTLATSDSPISPAGFLSLYPLTRWLSRCGLLIEGYKLKPADVTYLLAHASALGWLSFDDLNSPTPIELDRWLAFDRAMVYRRLLPDTTELGLFTIQQTLLPNAPDQANWLAAIAKWAGWNETQLKAVDAQLAPSFPGAYKDLSALDRLMSCMRWLGKSGMSVADTKHLLPLELGPAESVLVKQTVRSRYTDAQWLDLAKQLQDTVRGSKRDALVAFLTASNPARWPNADALYAWFLVDVQMESVMHTSRMVQAAGAVQLFVQRCLMNLEPDVRPDDLAWAQWKWMKNYRVWEANRKVFLYPENWIEPELRIDKSVFFKELENDLLQNELTTDVVETAYLAYLDKLETVARLEIVRQFYEIETRLLHVVGRTYGTEPHQYFYRRWEESHNWTPWEKVEVDITGDHLVLLMLNNRLHLYWLVFTDDVEEKDEITLPDQSQKTYKPDKNRSRLLIQVATSEYRRGKWTPKKLSVDTITTDYSTKKIDRTQLNLIPADLRLSIGRYYLIIGRTGETGSGYTSIGIFDIIGCHGVPEQAQEDYLPLAVLPMTERSSYVNTQLREWKGVDGPLQFKGGMMPFTGLHILNKTPGTFRILASNQLSQYDQFFQHLLAKILERFPQLEGWLNKLTRGKGQLLPLTVGTGLPFFYQDRTRTFFAIPEVVAGSWDKSKAPTEPGFFTFKNRYFFPDWDEQLNKYVKSLDIHQDWDDYLLSLWDNSVWDAIPDKTNINDATKAQIAAIDEEHKTKWNQLTAQVAKDFKANPFVFQLYFANYYHPFICLLKKELYRGGIEGMMQRDVQLLATARFPDLNRLDFGQTYDPTALPVSVVDKFDATAYPQEDIDFRANGSYASYNWELFFHAPLLIANQFSKNQQFEEAMRWYHLIFNPTLRASLPPAPSEPVPQRYWQTKPFFQQLSQEYINQRIDRILLQINGDDKAADDAVTQWRAHPFEPHRIAQDRPVAYQQTVVMKYLDNMIAWADQLFRRGSMESINEATQLYVMAAELLGPRPLRVPRTEPAVVKNFNQLSTQVDEFGNALIDLETSIVVDASSATGTDGDLLPRFDLYFCLPPNDKVLSYWDTLANRLFNIRNGKNIDGQDAIPALFEPPIDPAMLVRAAAAGLSMSSILSEQNAPLPIYRFPLMVQKAAELANEVKALGAALLSALEKRDAETMALLRSSLELKTLDAVRLVKEQQLFEAQGAIESIRRTRQLTETRLAHYKELAKDSVEASLSSFERQHISRTNDAQNYQEAGQALQLTGAVLGLIPDIRLGASGFGGSPVADASFGGVHLATALKAASDAMSFLALMANNDAARALTLGTHTRRWDDWQHQITLANKELSQIDQQILVAQIRETIAQQEIKNHELQIANAQKTDEQMRTKFTNKELYDWMVTQLSATYFQGYQLVFDVAKKAERCLRYELALSTSSYIQFGNWDSLKRGLLAGEKLHQDLKRMEVAYYDQNRREYEISRHISLALLNPIALLKLRQTGECYFDLPETLFDMDFPGHYLRRIKSASLSLPCVVGPYTSVNATLTLVRSSIRTKNTLVSNNQYARNTNPDQTPADDERFRDSLSSVQSIAISSGQSDSGLFEMNFRDERYMPFEGQGVISTWHLELNQEFRQFDYGTIADAILHIRYTAREGGEQLKQKASALVKDVLADFTKQLTTDKGEKTLLRQFSLRQDFPDVWHRFLYPANPTDTQQAVLNLADRFPYFTKGKVIECTAVELMAEAPAPIGELTFTPVSGKINLSADNTYGKLLYFKQDGLSQLVSVPWVLQNNAAIRLTEASLSDLMVIVHYTVK